MVKNMPEEQRNNCGCNNGGILGGLFGRHGCGCGCGSNSEVLFFLIVFLLLFTDFGCCCNN